MIQDTFWVMLWNHPDINYTGNEEYSAPGDWTEPLDLDDAGRLVGTDDWERARLAATLTANLIDFADGDDDPTPVPVIKPDGGYASYSVYGLERQPFISEVYTEVVVDQGTGQAVEVDTIFAIELHNPYDRPISLDGYGLLDASGEEALPDEIDDYVPENGSFEYLGESGAGGFFALDGVTIPAGGYIVCKGYGRLPSNVDDDVNLGDNVAFTLDSVIRLVRVYVDEQDGEEFTVAVDEQALTGEEPYFAGYGTVTSPRQGEVRPRNGAADNIGVAGKAASIQRDTSPGQWRVVVPRVDYRDEDLPVSQSDKIHTLGEDNSTDAETIDPLIRPVQVEFANVAQYTGQAGSLSEAFPTTGHLLLLMRYGQELDWSAADKVEWESTPFNHVKDGTGRSLAHLFDQIDNGRMPVFDLGNAQGPYYHRLTHPDTGDPVHGVEALPWGQLVFDYFTALPLNNGLEQLPNRARPKVEQWGARVYGRVNLNVAPYKVLVGLPMLDEVFTLPAFRQRLITGAYPLSEGTMPYPPTLDPSLIRPKASLGVQAYAEASPVSIAGCVPEGVDLTGGCTGNYAGRVNPGAGTPTVRLGRGFLTVGELLNIRHPDAMREDVLTQPPGISDLQYSPFRFDSGIVGRVANSATLGTTVPMEDYVQAVGKLVLLQDWVTTRSHVFTVYGKIQGGGDTQEYDKRALRFEYTIDRQPCFFEPDSSPRRIGQRVVENYLQAQ